VDGDRFNWLTALPDDRNVSYVWLLVSFHRIQKIERSSSLERQWAFPATRLPEEGTVTSYVESVSNNCI